MTHIYNLTDHERTIATEVEQLVADTIAPNAAETDSYARFPVASVDALRSAGLLGLTVPAACGGREQGPAAFSAVVEAIAQGCASTAMIYVMHVSGTQAIVASESVAARDAILRDIASGKHLTTLAFSERGSRSQFWAPVSQLTSNGDAFQLSASKSWVTTANHADSYIASTQQPDAASPMESTLLVVRRNASGVQPTAAFDGLGLRGNDSVPVELTNVKIDAGDLLTAQGAGMSMMLEKILPWFAVGTAAMAHGLCRAAIAATTQHLTTGAFETDGSRLCDLPNLRSRLAEMHLRMEQSRSLLGFTLQAITEPNEMTPVYVLQSRSSALQVAVEVTDLAMKACGGAAFSKHLGIERLFRNARAGWVMAPTVDQLQDFVGRALCGMPLF